MNEFDHYWNDGEIDELGAMARGCGCGFAVLWVLAAVAGIATTALTVYLLYLAAMWLRLQLGVG